jgi:glyoxylase-like metal-dependent hydrolase (beta-lactamase superfamily II)
LARFELTAGDEAAAQLERLGISPTAVRWVVLSHLHTDHAGGLAPFSSAEVLVSRTEWELATGWRGRVRGYLPQHWPAGVVPRLVEAQGPALGPFPWSLDIAGDGSLVVVPTPGHTPGHLGLLVRAERRWLLAGDLVHDPGELATVAPELDFWCRSSDVTVLTAHDPAAPRLARGGSQA